MNTAASKMDTIREVFQAARVFSSEEGNLQKIKDYCENADIEFRSIAYEAASMSIALKDIESGTSFQEWKKFADEFAAVHAAQVYSGLGWAIARETIPLDSILEELPPLHRYRVADGCGYYDGTFRNRQTVRNKQVPTYSTGKALAPYYQGVGRSLWYTAKGDPAKVNEMISSWSHLPEPVDHGDLWRGLGTALAYVGGADDETIHQVLNYAAEYKTQLGCGVILAVRSRTEAGSLTKDAESTCKLVCKLSASEVFRLSNSALPVSVKNDEAYFEWLNAIEQVLSF